MPTPFINNGNTSAGFCPTDGEKLDFLSEQEDVDEMVYKVACSKCGRVFNEYYDMIFRGHILIDKWDDIVQGEQNDKTE